MRLVRKGTKRFCVCNSCGSQLSYEGNDILLSVNDFREEYSYETYIDCPVCNSIIILAQLKEIEQEVKEND